MTSLRFLNILLALLLIAFLVAFPRSTRASSSITIGTTEPLPGLDPASAGDVFSWEVLSHLYIGLTRQIPGSLRYELALAASHAVSADGLTHRFAIRPDAAFDDGTPITAQTFARSINRVLGLQGPGSQIARTYIKSADVDGDGSLILSVSAPIPFMEQLLALPPFFPVHPADFAGSDQTPTHFNGLYRPGAQNTADSLTLLANPSYHGSQAGVSTIILKHYAAPEDLRRALLAHQVDIAWRGLPPDDVQIAAQNSDIQVITAPGLQTFYLLIGQQLKPYNDQGLRQGMLYLLDREQVAKTSLRGTGIPLYGLLPPELAGQETPTYPKYDLEQGRTALDHAGYSQYHTADSDLESARLAYGDAYFRAVDQFSGNLNLSRAIRTTTQDVVPQTLFDQIDQGALRLAVIGWTPLVPHPDAYLRPLLYSAGQLAAGVHYANPQIDELLDKAALTGDTAAQAALYDQAQSLGLKNVVAIPLWQGNQTLLAWKSISGVEIEPNYLLHYDRLSAS